MNDSIQKLNIGDWVLIHWDSDSDSPELVHPSDLEELIIFLPPGGTVPSQRIANISGFTGNYAILEISKKTFRIQPDPSVIKKVIYNGEFNYGDLVKDITGKYEGEILTIGWMYKYKKPVFILKKNGKIIKKRFYQEDLEKI